MIMLRQLAKTWVSWESQDYIAPEVCSGKNLPNTASDRYSLAMVLFMLLLRGTSIWRKERYTDSNDRCRGKKNLW